MKKRLLILLAILISNIAYSQNIVEIQQNIKSSVETFFSYVSDINDPVEPLSIGTIVSTYTSEGNYFYFNGNSSTLTAFLNSYIDNHIGSRLISHQLSNIKIAKVDKPEDNKLYNVSATLKRESATGEDIVIKDEQLSLVVLWNEQCSIVQINLDPALKITYPTTKHEYTLEIDRINSKYHVKHEGGPWNLTINSSRQTIKEYEGYPQLTTTIKKEPWDFQIFSDNTNHIKQENNNIQGTLGPNLSKEQLTFDITFQQLTSEKTITAHIYQAAKDRFRLSNLFEVWDIPTHNISLAYSMKYQMGLSYMYSYEYTRVALGALIHVNCNSFKGWKIRTYDWYGTSNSYSDIDTYKANGYEVTVKKVKPEKKYSTLFDPHNTAETLTARSLYMFQAGCYLNSFIRLEFGLGGVAYKDKIHVDEVYKYELHSYKPLSEDYPEIADTYSYSWYESDYFFNSRYKWDFALRTGINCCIPLDSYRIYFLNLGAGYVIVPNNTTCNSLDFQFGFGWYF